MRRIHHRSDGLGLIAGLASLLVTYPAHAAGRYDPILEWNGPEFRVLHASDRPQWIDDPSIELPFIQPRGIVGREHDERDVIYVLDAGRHRILAFEANATYIYLSSFDLAYSATPGAGEWSDSELRTPQYLATPTRWIVPFSEAVHIAGEAWTRVDDLTGFAADDHVYTIDYAATTNQPSIQFPSGSLASDTIFEVRYLLSDLQDEGSATPVFGLGEIDRGVHSGNLSFTRVTIDEQSGGPTRWDEPRGMALAKGVTDTTTDVLYVVDAGDASGAQNEQIFSFEVTTAGSVTAGEAYDDRLTNPYDATVADRGTGAGASAWLSDDSGPFDQSSYPFVVDASQVTGHDYTIDVASGVVTITDVVTGRVLVRAGAEADFADPCRVIPGLSLPLNGAGWSDGTSTLHTTRAYPARFLFATDTGGDRIKVISLPSGVTAAGSVWDGDWLPGDARVGATQPTGAGTIGASAGDEYSERTPSTVGENFTAWTAASPLREESLDEIVFDPSGLARHWRRVDNLEVATPTDSVFAIDEMRGAIIFGDGIHGAIPPASTEFVYSYSTSPDVLRYGSSGTALGRFVSPRGVGARWNRALGRFDLYIADTANLRVQKLAFFPADTTLHLPARIVPITSWREATNDADLMDSPGDVAVASDSIGTVHVAVTDPAKNRVILYRDTEASTPNSTQAPSFFKVLGTAGNRLGSFVEPASASFLPNGADLDLYLTDDARNIALKYEGGPDPSIDLITVGESELPASFPPHSGYVITFETRYPPLGGWVDFYFDTKDTFDESSARLCFPVGTVSPTATTAFWSFADSPGGMPPDGSYYLFARLKDTTGSTVAWDQTDILDLITIDSHLLPTLQARDAIDGDETLYLQNNLERDVHLELLYPDSTIGASFVGRYDPRLIAIEGVTQGTAWDGLGGTNVIFAATVDSVNGRFEVNSSVVSAPTGLTRSGPFIVATLHVHCRGNAIDLVTRFKDGTVTLDPALTKMTRVDGTNPESYRVRSLNLRVAYLGDIATTGAGADSLVPYQMPRPDGHIDFDDQMVFTLGWNGLHYQQDRIADLGPASGASPTLLPAPDAAWDVDDILVFTSQSSYFSTAGWNNGGNPPGARAPDVAQRGATSTSEAAPCERVAPQGRTAGVDLDPQALTARWQLDGTSALLEIEARELENLCGLAIRLSSPAQGVRLTSIEAGELLVRGAQVMVLSSEESGATVLGLSRLSMTHPGVSGSGVLARLFFSIESAETFDEPTIRYECRDASNRTLAIGDIAPRERPTPIALPSELSFDPLIPNPARAAVLFRFGLPRAAQVTLRVFDVQGRLVRRLIDGAASAGWTVTRWDGRTSTGALAPSGVYFARLDSGEGSRQRTLVLSR